MRPPSLRGYLAVTLTELVVAMTLLLVLAILGLQGLKSMNESSHSARCTANLRQLGATTLLYTQENNGYFPQIYRLGSSGHWYYNAKFLALLQTPPTAMWRGSTKPYLCPSDPDGMSRISIDGKTRFLSYAGNLPLGAGDSAHAESPFRTVRHSSVHHPAKLLLFVDGNNFFINAGSVASLPARHRKGMNVLYADGHVQWQRSPLPNDAAAPELWWPDGVRH